jgi:hypothetical protein
MLSPTARGQPVTPPPRALALVAATSMAPISESRTQPASAIAEHKRTHPPARVGKPASAG